MPKKKTRRGFGGIRRLPSGRYQAYYSGPDLARHVGPTTFTARVDAESWLAAERHLIETGAWSPPVTRTRSREGLTLAEYAPDALDRRRVRGEPLRPRTRRLYESQLRRLVLPAFGDVPLTRITADAVRTWHDQLDPAMATQKAHAYSLLRTLLGQAVDEGHLAVNPARIKGAGKARRKRSIRIATVAEVDAVADAIEPPELRALVLIAAWCGLRAGELQELRRRDIDLDRGVLHVRRAVVRVDGRDLVGPPKSEAGQRTIWIPPHLTLEIEKHLAEHVGRGPDALLFARPGNRHWAPTEVSKRFAAAREAAGRPDLRLHDLRHTGATWAAQAGATLAELMARIGHNTPTAALRYQHAAAGRDAEIARRLSEFAELTQS